MFVFIGGISRFPVIGSRSRPASLEQRPGRRHDRRQIRRVLQSTTRIFMRIDCRTTAARVVTTETGATVNSLCRFFPSGLTVFRTLRTHRVRGIVVLGERLLRSTSLGQPFTRFVSHLIRTRITCFRSPVPRIICVRSFITPRLFILFSRAFGHRLVRRCTGFLQR